MLGPNPVLSGCGPHTQALAKEAHKLQADPAVIKAVMKQVSQLSQSCNMIFTADNHAELTGHAYGRSTRL